MSSDLLGPKLAGHHAGSERRGALGPKPLVYTGFWDYACRVLANYCNGPEQISLLLYFAGGLRHVCCNFSYFCAILLFVGATFISVCCY
jgi:hypothetical protein